MGIFDKVFGKGKEKVKDKAKAQAAQATPPPPPSPEQQAAQEAARKAEEEQKAEEKAQKKEQTRQQEQAMMDQAMGDMRAKQAAALEADPGLTAPFEGVTVEIWAKAAATFMQVQDPAQQAQALAGMGMDRAKYERVNVEFQARMQRDTTGALMTAYGNAFAAAQGVDHGGAEPCSFEKYAELAGAQAAWGETGVDVNAKLQEVFGIAALDWSNYSSYWNQKFMADYTLMEKHSKLSDKFKAKYKSGSDLDDDLDI